MDHDSPSHDDEEVIFQNEHSSSSYEASEESDVADQIQVDSFLSPRTPRRSNQDNGPGSISRASSRGSQRQPRARKRKATLQEARRSKVTRYTGLYSNDYRKLLNEDIEDATLQTLAQEQDTLFKSQIGMTIWTSQEKQLFFTALGRLGRDDVEGIARRVGTKSALEVQDYALLLHKGMVEHCLKDARYGLHGLSEFPAAIQISPDCEDELETAAQVLSFRQERYEEGVEEKKWGSVPWLLDSKANLWIVERLAAEDEGQSLRDGLPSAELLNLTNFLELSSRIFMNPGPSHEDENWQFLAEADEEQPAIRTTCFEDFHSLVTSVTKRLVSATLFCTMSRLRATDSSSFDVAPVVRAADVKAAAKTIGMALNSDQFWIECARRCHLNVYRRKADREPMSYEDVESALAGKDSTLPLETEHLDLPSSPETSSTSSESDDSDADAVPRRDNMSSDLDDDSRPPLNQPRNLAAEYLSLLQPQLSDTYPNPIDPSDSESAPTMTRATQRLRARDAAEDAQHSYADLLDMRASLAEEQRLWSSVLRREPPFKIEVEDIPLPEEGTPAIERKEGEDLVDWRERCEFWDWWEREAVVERKGGVVVDGRRRRRRSSRESGKRVDEGEDEEMADEKADESESEIDVSVK